MPENQWHRRKLSETWLDAWMSSTFWKQNQPESHFHGLATVGTLFATAVLQLARERGLRRIIDIGAGHGALLNRLHTLDPTLDLVGIDQRPQPPGCPGTWWMSQWSTDSWSPGLEPLATEPALIVALELLDDIPAPVVQRVDGVWRHQCPDGSLGPAIHDAEVSWLERWWDEGVPHAEVGHGRDSAWTAIARAASPGSTLLMVDYGHIRGERRPTFTAHRAGHMIDPARLEPSDVGSVNLTAHVAVDAVDAAMRNAGAERHAMDRVRNVIAQMDSLAPHAPSAPDALTDLARRGERHFYNGPAGDFWWLCHTMGPCARRTTS